MARYAFPHQAEFRDRRDDLAAITAWFEDGSDRRALSVFGRRRVGKSWLVRAFAHDREVDLFVATTRSLADQLDGFATVLEREGERPAIPDLESFLRLLYRRARNDRRLAVIDELPYLWTAERDLPSILQKVMEEEAGTSLLRLIVTGSHIGMMQELLAERAPLHGRLRPLQVRPLDLWAARELLGIEDPVRLITAYGIAGGMPRYLAELAGADDPVARLARASMDPRAGLFDEPRAVLAQELDIPHTYFSLLAALATKPQGWGDLASRSKVESDRLGRYLHTLEQLGIVAARVPVTDRDRATRNRLYEITDGFMRFWFRYVFPLQADLEAGLPVEVALQREVRPTIADHLAPVAERIVRDWARRGGIGGATQFGAWWGPSAPEVRRSTDRHVEEIDLVGMTQGQVTTVGEVRWRNQPMGPSVLSDLRRYKLPALRRAATVVAEPQLVLVSRGGFTTGLEQEAAGAPNVRLVSPADLVA